MTYTKIAYFTIAAAAVVTHAPTAYANSTTLTSVAVGVNSPETGVSGVYRGPIHNIADRLLGSSSTATFFYKKGVKNFEKGNLEKSESAFEASLRAHGSKSMDGLTLHYLTLINHKQGDEVQKKKYAQAYFDLDKK